MMNFADLVSAPCNHLEPFTDQLRLAVAAYLARFKGSSRYDTESDLRCYLSWCSQHRLDPLAARRPHLELYIPAGSRLLEWCMGCLLSSDRFVRAGRVGVT
jgi:hypothetical protein